jgi:hypothetical protein
MQETIVHHLAGIVIATLCVAQVSEPTLHEDPALVALCQESIASQLRQIALDRIWLRDGYGLTDVGEIPTSAAQDIRRLSTLAGEDFEHEALTEFSKHHLQIIKQSVHVVGLAEHGELRREAHMRRT